MRRPSALVPPQLPDLLTTAQARELRNTTPPAALQPLEVRRSAYVALDPASPKYAVLRARLLGAVQLVHGRMTSNHVFVRETAAVLHGLRTWTVPRRAEVGVPPGSSGNPSIRVRRLAATVPDDERDTAAGLPVTSVDRTVLDIARFCPPGDALVPIDHFLAAATGAYPGQRERTATRAADLKKHLLRMLDRFPPGNPGTRRARAVIEHASPWSESAGESRLRWILLVAGFTTVVAQVEVRVGPVRFRSDLAIPIGRRADGRTIWLHIEFDGRVKYSGGDATATSETLRRERERELSITGTGDRLVRFTFRDLADPAAVVAEVRRHLTDVAQPPLRPVRALAA